MLFFFFNVPSLTSKVLCDFIFCFYFILISIILLSGFTILLFPVLLVIPIVYLYLIYTNMLSVLLLNQDWESGANVETWCWCLETEEQTIGVIVVQVCLSFFLVIDVVGTSSSTTLYTMYIYMFNWNRERLLVVPFLARYLFSCCNVLVTLKLILGKPPRSSSLSWTTVLNEILYWSRKLDMIFFFCLFYCYCL